MMIIMLSSSLSPLTRQTFQEEGLHERGSGTALSPLRPTALVTLIVMMRMVMVLLMIVMMTMMVVLLVMVIDDNDDCDGVERLT